MRKYDMAHPTDPDVRLKALTIVWFARVTITLVCVGLLAALLGSNTPRGTDLRATITTLAVLWIPTGVFLNFFPRRLASEADKKCVPAYWPFVVAFLWPLVFAITIVGIIPLLFLFWSTFAGEMYGNLVGHPYLGAMIGYFVWVPVIALIAWCARLLKKWNPEHPPCRQCGSDDCAIVPFAEMSEQESSLRNQRGGFVYHCRCGTKYLFSPRYRFYMVINSDGEAEAYMRKRPWGLWIPARAQC
jgi:hypothetical protein